MDLRDRAGVKLTLGVDDIGRALDGSEKQVAGFLTGAMRDTTDNLKSGQREQTVAAGLGTRLSNTWRGKAYPESGDSLDPAAYVWSNAPTIVTAFDQGAVILPTGGRKYLWVPTKNVPSTRKGGGRGAKKKADPIEVQAIFNQDFTMFRSKAGRLLAFVDARGSRNRTLRSAAKARGTVKGKPQLILMFTLVPTVRVAKRLDIKLAADAAAARFPANLEARWR